MGGGKVSIHSKPLGENSHDISGHEFMQEIYTDERGVKQCIGGINIDIIFFDGKFYVVELLLCDEKQLVNPHTSHPNRYFYKNRRKFLSLWKLAKELKGELWLINYAKKGTKHEDKVRLIKVLEMNSEKIVRDETIEYSRQEFKEFFLVFNETVRDNDAIMKEFAQKLGSA